MDMQLFVWDADSRVIVAMAYTLEEARQQVRDTSLRAWSAHEIKETAHDHYINRDPDWIYDLPHAIVVWADVYSVEK